MLMVAAKEVSMDAAAATVLSALKTFLAGQDASARPASGRVLW